MNELNLKLRNLYEQISLNNSKSEIVSFDCFGQNRKKKIIFNGNFKLLNKQSNIISLNTIEYKEKFLNKIQINKFLKSLKTKSTVDIKYNNEFQSLNENNVISSFKKKSELDYSMYLRFKSLDEVELLIKSEILKSKYVPKLIENQEINIDNISNNKIINYITNINNEKFDLSCSSSINNSIFRNSDIIGFSNEAIKNSNLSRFIFYSNNYIESNDALIKHIDNLEKKITVFNDITPKELNIIATSYQLKSEEKICPTIQDVLKTKNKFSNFVKYLSGEKIIDTVKLF